MVVLPLPFLRSIGFAGMLIPLVSVLVATSLLPLVLAKFGPRLDWPHVRREDRASRAWTSWAKLVVRLRWPSAVTALAVLIALVIAATGLEPGTANVNTLSRSGTARTGLVVLERSGIGAGALQPIEVLAPAGSTATRVAAALARVPGIHGAVVPGGSQWQRAGIAEVDAFPVPDPSTSAGGTVLTAARSAAHATAAGASVGGLEAENSDFVSAIYGSFPEMIALIAVLTFLLLARAFRSLLLPLKAVVLNVISVSAAWGVITLFWQQGHGSSPRLRDRAHALGDRVDSADGVRVPVRAEAWTTRSSSSPACARSTTATGVHAAERSSSGYRPDRPARDERRADLVPGVRVDGVRPETDVKVFATGLAAGILLDATVIRALLVPAHRFAARPLELVAPRAAGTPVAGRAVAAAATGAGRRSS